MYHFAACSDTIQWLDRVKKRRRMQRLKEVRNQRGLSQGRLAELSGVSRPSIARIETRTDYTPRDTTIRSLTKTLGVIDVELLSDEEFGRELESATLDQLGRQCPWLACKNRVRASALQRKLIRLILPMGAR